MIILRCLYGVKTFGADTACDPETRLWTRGFRMLLPAPPPARTSHAADPADGGMFVTMTEHRLPVARSKAVRFFICRHDGFVRRTIHRKPAARLSRWVISATCLSCCTMPSWSTTAHHAAAGQ
jgi:hypothetical protein